MTKSIAEDIEYSREELRKALTFKYICYGVLPLMYVSNKIFRLMCMVGVLGENATDDFSETIKKHIEDNKRILEGKTLVDKSSTSSCVSTQTSPTEVRVSDEATLVEPTEHEYIAQVNTQETESPEKQSGDAA